MDIDDRMPPISETPGDPPVDRATTTHTIHLAHSEKITIMEDDVPNPPAPLFADNIACLASIWDDESPLWDLSQAVFKLKDRPIALKHWVDVYSRWKRQQWDGLKKPYSQWKVSPSCRTFSLSGG